MGDRVEILEGVVSALADTFYELSGRLLTKSVGAYTAGSATLNVRGTHRWPTSGRIAVGGVTLTYSGITNTSFTGLLDEDANPGAPLDLPADSTVMDISESTTQFDTLKASFFRETAEEEQLDIYARNFGLSRPRGLVDSTFVDVLGAMVYLDAQTEYACTKVLDALVGAGNYTMYEDVETSPHTVFVDIAPSLSSVYAGKAYLCGGEEQASTSPVTVDVKYPPTVVYGVYASSDPYRVLTNFANETMFARTYATNPKYLVSTLPVFLPEDEGKAVLFASGEIWSIRAYLDPFTLQLGSKPRHDGTVNTGAPTILSTGLDRFRTWMVGHNVVMSGVNSQNTGIYPIIAVNAPNEVELGGAAAFVTETDVTWELAPNFGTVAPFTVDIPRATAVGLTVTTPVVIPANVLVDYATVPSAEIVQDQNDSGNDQYPFYIFDETWLIELLLDLVTAAGVRVVVEVV